MSFTPKILLESILTRFTGRLLELLRESDFPPDGLVNRHFHLVRGDLGFGCNQDTSDQARYANPLAHGRIAALDRTNGGVDADAR